MPRDHLQRPMRLSLALAIVAGVAAAVGAFIPSVFRDPAMWAGNARGTSCVVLLVAMPVLIEAMMRARQGSRRAQVVWAGALGYILYNAVLFTFAVTFNRMFFVYVAMLSLGTWSLVSLLGRIDVDAFAAEFSERLPVRAIGAYLVLTAVAFAALWLADVAPALMGGSLPASLRGTSLVTNPIEVMDFAFTLPLCALGGVWLWRRLPRGYLIAGITLVGLLIESVSVATDQFFGHVADPAQPTTAIPVFVALTIVGLVPLMVYLKYLDGGSRSRERQHERRSATNLTRRGHLAAHRASKATADREA